MQVTIEQIIKQGLDEDLGVNGDITSNFTIPADKNIKFQIKNREEIILCGVDIVRQIFEAVERRLKTDSNFHWNGKAMELRINFNDGDFLPKNSVIIEGSGNARSIFAGERLVLNLMQHLSGIATTTSQYVKQLANNKTRILDTRKTIPGLRELQKYAVKIGGGKNHRLALYDGILIKDNHISAAGGIAEAVAMVKEKIDPNFRLNDDYCAIEVECDNLEQVQEALTAKADIIMLDNMNLEQIKKAVSLISGKAKIEVSGGVSLEKIKEISKTGVDYISVGTLTHSVKAVDIGLDVI